MVTLPKPAPCLMDQGVYQLFEPVKLVGVVKNNFPHRVPVYLALIVEDLWAPPMYHLFTHLGLSQGLFGQLVGVDNSTA